MLKCSAWQPEESFHSQAVRLPTDNGLVDLDPLSHEDSIKYLVKATITKRKENVFDYEKAAPIATELNGNPLALVYAASYFSINPGTDTGKYIEYLGDRLATMDLNISNHPLPPIATFQISLAQADKDDADSSNPVGAKFIICLASFFNIDRIPSKIFFNAHMECFTEIDPFMFSCIISQEKQVRETKIEEAISRLNSYSLIEENYGEKTFSLSRIAQLAAQNLVKKNESMWIAFALIILEIDFPMVSEENYTQCNDMSHHVDYILRHAKRVFDFNNYMRNYMRSEIEEIFAPSCMSLLNKYASYLFEIANYHECLIVRHDLITFYKKYYNRFSFEIAKSYKDLALTYRALGKVSEADEAYKISIEIFREIDSDALALIEVLRDYAWWYANSNRIDEAKKMYSDLRLLCKNHREKDSVIFAQILFDFGTFCRQTERPDKIIRYYYSKAIEKISIDKNSSEAARFQNGLAWYYASLERFDEAKKLYEEVLSIRENLKPSVPDDIATTLVDLADVLRKMHPYSIDAISSHKMRWKLGFRCCQSDKDRKIEFQQKADENFRRAITLLKKRYEKPNPNLARALFRFGQSYAESGRYKQGRERCVEAFKMFGDVYLKEKENVADYIKQIDSRSEQSRHCFFFNTKPRI